MEQFTNINSINNVNSNWMPPNIAQPVVNQPPAVQTNPYPYMPMNNYQYAKSYVYPQIVWTNPIQAMPEIPGITDPTIKEALNKLREVRFLPGDMEHMKRLGVNTIYNNGEEAIQNAIQKGIKIEFGPVSNPKVHAQWENEKNTVIINDKYKGTKDISVILAISEAIFHELGHAKDADNVSSIQEELDCLALNTLANRYHQQYYPAAFTNSANADILNDGVCLYTKLFFDPDPQKAGLVKRIKEKYGDLPIESANHTTSITAKVVDNVDAMN